MDNRRIYYTTFCSTGRHEREWSFCFSYKKGESCTVCVHDPGSEINMEALLEAAGFTDVDNFKAYKREVFGHDVDAATA